LSQCIDLDLALDLYYWKW